MEVSRTPDERFESLPGWPYDPRYVEVEDDLAGTLRLHYVDEGQGPPVVCFHGEPDWGYLYRKLVPPLLSAGHRVILPDYAGFGRSDKPTDIGWYSYDRHYALVSALLGTLDLRAATVVVQDWGGPIGLRWAVDHPDRVAALGILNTGLFAGRVSKGFMAWRDFAERNPDLPVGFIMQRATATELPDDVVAAYEAPFPTPESKAGAAAFPLLVPLSEDDPGASEMARVRDELSRWQKPAMVAFSDQDPVFPFPRAGQAFSDLIPTAGEQVRIEGAHHMVQEDAGEQVADHLVAFMREARIGEAGPHSTGPAPDLDDRPPPPPAAA